MNRITSLLSIILVVLLLIFTFEIFFRPITSINQDLGRHIKLGEIIWTTKHIPSTNLFSYTSPNQQFINHHWGSEAIYFLLYSSIGFNGIEIVNVLAAFFSFGIVFYIAAKKSSLWTAGIVGCIFIPIILERTDVRPEVFGYLFTALTLYILLCRKLGIKEIVALCFIELIWVNIHISFIFGIILVGFYIVSYVFTHGLKKIPLPILGVVPLIILAGLVNPHGVLGLLEPLAIFQNYGYSIVENQTVFFLYKYTTDPILPYFFAASVISFISSLVLLKRKQYFGGLVGLFFTVLAYSASRHFPFFILTTFIPVCMVFGTIKKYIAKGEKIILATNLIFSLWVGWWITSIGSGSIYKQWGMDKRVGLGVVRGAKGALDFVEKYNISGPMFNNFDIGSYIIFRLYPKEKVFVDGRPEVYSVDFFQKIYIPMQQEKEVWDKVDKQYNFKSIIFAHTDQTPWGITFVQRIVTDQKWKTVYLDETMIVLVKKSEYPNLPDISPATYTLSSKLSSLESSWMAYRRMANFFSMIGRNDIATWYYQQSNYLP